MSHILFTLRAAKAAALKTVFGVAALSLMVAACGGASDEGPGSDEDYARGLCSAYYSFGQAMEEQMNLDASLSNIGSPQGVDPFNEENLRLWGIDPDRFADLDEADKFPFFFATVFQKLGGPMVELAKDLDKLRPPEDVRPFHEKQVEVLTKGGDAFKSLDFSALIGAPIINGPEDIELPQDIQDRIAAASVGLPECKGVPLFSDG